MNRVCIIAEAGVNHNGNIYIAKKLITAAAEAKADIVKFQTFKAKNIVSKYAPKAEYQKETTCVSESQEAMLSTLELSQDEHLELIEHCKTCGIQFLSTPFDIDSINFLESIDMPFWKIPSGEITNLPYLIRLAKTGKDIVLSTGMCTLDEVRMAINTLKKYGSGEISVLHCTTEYPTPYKDVNLRAMTMMRDEFNVRIGYSDHTLGIEIPIAAVAMGATIIEKHFTLDKNMEGPDHKASLEPHELSAMVQAIRNIETALGSGIKTPSPSECKNIDIARKSIVAIRNIQAGEIFDESNITTKRPGNGISPMRWFEIIGKKACRDFEEDELIEL